MLVSGTAGYCLSVRKQRSTSQKYEPSGMDYIRSACWCVPCACRRHIAKAIYPGYQGGGILATMVLGIVGAFIGGTLATLLTTGRLYIASASFSLPGLFVAVIGALIAIWIWHMMHRRAY